MAKAKRNFKFELKNVKTPAFTISYCDTFTGEPEVDEDTGKSTGKRSFQMLFPNGTNLKALKKEADRVAKECFEKKEIKKLNLPFNEIDEDDKEEYEYLEEYDAKANASTWKKKKVLPIIDRMNKKLNLIEDEDELQEELYAGCECKAMVYFSPYEHKGKKGIAIRVASLIKLADGEPLSGSGSSSNAEEDFSDELDEEVEIDEDGESGDSKLKEVKRNV